MKGRFYRLAAAGAVCLMLLLSGMTALAARTGTVRINDVNVRTEASAESDRVCKLPINTTVSVVDETQGSDGYTWYSITFTYEGAEKAGWIRSDMLAVSESEEEPEEGGAGTSGAYTIQEPEEAYSASDSLVQTVLAVGEDSFTAWQVSTELTGGSELYLVYASGPDGSTGWFYYDPQDQTFQRDMGQFASGSSSDEPEGLIVALQNELTGLKETSAQQLSQRLYIIIGLGVLSAVLLILVIVFAVKYRNAEYEYYDDEDEEDEEDEEPVKEKRGFFKRRRDEDEEEDDFDDFLAAVKKKRGELEEDEDELDAYPEEEEDEPDLSLSAELPEIDMSAVLEAEEESRKAEAQQEASPEEAADGGTSEQEALDTEALDDEDFDIDGFDIEILDLDDLDL